MPVYGHIPVNVSNPESVVNDCLAPGFYPALVLYLGTHEVNLHACQTRNCLLEIRAGFSGIVSAMNFTVSGTDQTTVNLAVS